MDATADTTTAEPVTVETGARLHFGFGNLSLAHGRLYGAAGVAVEDPKLRLTVEPDQSVESSHETAQQYAERACSLLDVPGATVTVHETLPRHMGLGSGTQIALAVFAGVARAYGHEPQIRDRAPELGRGGRSGIGVAAFERGGFLLDAGHPTERFTADRPADGNWTVPPVTARHSIPDDWRFLVVIPDAEPGRAGDGEESSIRAVVEAADPDVADRIAGVIARQLLPAVAEGALDRFGSAVREMGRLNGTWFADEQGGVYRPPVGEVVAELTDAPAVSGVGQSSWGPAVYAVTDADRADAARDAGRDALDSAGVDGDVRVVAGRNRGATIQRDE